MRFIWIEVISFYEIVKKKVLKKGEASLALYFTCCFIYFISYQLALGIKPLTTFNYIA